MTIVRASFGYDGVRGTVAAAQRVVALEPGPTSPRAGLVRFALGAGLYLSGNPAGARNALEEALEVITRADQPLLRVVAHSLLSVVAAEEGHLEEAESRAREAGVLVDRLRLSTVTQATLAPIAVGFVLAKRGKLEEAETELEAGLSVRRELPGLTPGPPSSDCWHSPRRASRAAIEPGVGRCSPRRGPCWRGIPMQASYPSF